MNKLFDKEDGCADRGFGQLQFLELTEVYRSKYIF